jgi:hypothetical protein
VTEAKPATAARIYDFHLGGTHNFPADREAAMMMAQMFPKMPLVFRANRAFLQRAVRFVAGQGVRQFLDIGSGIPTEGNVHEVLDATIENGRVVYVDIDPVAVSEGLDILEGNPRAIAVHGDLRDPQPIIDNPQVRELLDFSQPVGLLLVAVLHFVPNDVAYDAVARLLDALPSGSFLVASHGTFQEQDLPASDVDTMKEIYRQRTATPLNERSRDEIARFFDGLEMNEPGLVWLPEWRPEPTDPQDFVNDPPQSAALAGVGRKP